METILEKQVTELGYRAAFTLWFQQTARPFIARWWIWFALIGSPAYLTYYFSERSLEERITETLKRGDEQEKEANQSKGNSVSLFYRSGYFVGRIVGITLKAWRPVSAILLLLVARLRLQYQHFFQPLFERDASGRRVYLFLAFFGWLFLAFIFRILIGDKGAELDFDWSIANTIMLIVLGYNLLTSWQNGRRRQLILVQQRTQAELDALKAQVNPHFLFNSLNSIYGTAIVEDSPRTAESIQQLSGIVRYVMEESRLQTTDVRRELRFIDDYVELQRVRIPNQENIQITTDIEWDEKPAQIVPLLLNPLIENAFKYGISIQYPCFVRIQLRVQDGTLRMTTENSILPVVDSTRTDLEKGTGIGIGLTNVRQRLELAYPGQHLLTVNETDDVFLVDLTIKLSVA